jgi:hypothetical protein
MSNNWHRIIWRLSRPDPVDDEDGFFLDNFFHETNSNQFWLEPEWYAGPTVTVGAGAGELQFPANSLCFRIRFLDGSMRAIWKDCVLFPAGSEALEFDDKGKPVPALDTEQLVGRTKVNGEDATVTIYMDTRPATNPTQLRIFAADEGVGNHLGAGIAHQ